MDYDTIDTPDILSSLDWKKKTEAVLRLLQKQNIDCFRVLNTIKVLIGKEKYLYIQPSMYKGDKNSDVWIVTNGRTETFEKDSLSPLEIVSRINLLSETFEK